MSTAVINTWDLGKRYFLGENAYPLGGRTFRDAVNARIRRTFIKKSKPGSDTQTLWALRNVTLEVGEGEILGIIGNNGSGKSTLLKLLSRITRPSQGRASVCGKVASLLEVGTGFHRELTGRENIILSGAVLGMRRTQIAAHFDEIVSFAGVEAFLDTPVKRYSTGMYLRLAFSVAAHLQPDILLVDEVLAVGDAEFQKKCIGKMGEVVCGGRTVLFVSHNLAAVRGLCPRTILLDGGRMIGQGPSDEVIKTYLGTLNEGGNVREITTAMHDPQYRRDAAAGLLRVELENSYGGAFTVRWRETIRLSFAVEVRRPLPDAVFGIRIDSAHGPAIFGCHHTDSGDGSVSLRPGRYQVNVQVSNNLQSGRYVLAFGAHSAISKDIYFLVPHAATVDVLDISHDSSPYTGKHLCLVNGQANWEIRDGE